jgi:hypothetical protein
MPTMGCVLGFNLREEIGFAWRSAQSLWRQFDQAREQPGGDAWGISQRFATELLRQCFAFQLTQHSTPMVVAERQLPGAVQRPGCACAGGGVAA